MRSKKMLKKVGGLSGRVVGVQYYDAVARSGDEVGFERDPHNEFDANAVRVVDSVGRPLGHVERSWAAWLAPLIDAGEIFLKGRVSALGDDWSFPVDISVYATKKGGRIFKKSREDSPEKVVHNHLLDIYGRAGEYSAETLSKLRELYSGMMAGDTIAPETKLLYHMLEREIETGGVVDDDDAERCSGEIERALDELVFGAPLEFGETVILPLLSKGERGENAPYAAGKRAIEAGDLVVEEIGSGEVSKLRAVNRGRAPVMLVAGEGVKGAKQDRVINITVVVEPSESVVLPVSCVERGRWRYAGGEKFHSADFATSAVRGRLLEDVVRNTVAGTRNFEGDQDMVWHTVASEAMAHGAESPTESLNEVYKKRGRDLKKALDKLRPPSGAVGAAVFRYGQIVSVDVFSHPSLALEYWDEIAKSAVMESLAVGAADDGETPKMTKRKASSMARSFLKRFLSSPPRIEASPSRKGRVAVFENEHVSGAALVHDGTFAHLAGYRHEVIY